MFVDFDSLSGNAEIWYFQANRDLSQEEINEISDFLEQNMEGWAAHGAPLKSSLKIAYNRVMLVALDADYQKATGCSIDKFSDWIIDLNRRLNVDLFDRSIAYFENEELKFFPIFQAKKYIMDGTIQPDTKVLNHLIKTKSELDTNWLIPAGDSFMKTHFNVAAMAKK